MSPFPYPVQDYPRNEDEWKRFPFGDQMVEAFKMPHNVRADKQHFSDHNRQVHEAVLKLWEPADGKTRIVSGSDDKCHGRDAYSRCLEALRGERADKFESALVPPGLDRTHLQRVANLRLLAHEEHKDELMHAALFHDIGKQIILERHPIVGWHMVADLYPDNRTKLEGTIGAARLRTLLMLIRDHDKFGVLSTGEASLPILLPVAKHIESEDSEARRSLAMLFLLTLADIAGSNAAKPDAKKYSADQIWLVDAKVHLLCTDWARFDKVLEKTEKERERLIEETVRLCQTPKATIERIHRLVLDSCKLHPTLAAELAHAGLIEDALEDAFGPHMHQFCENFALIAKLDYGLYFLRHVMTYAVKKGIRSTDIIETVIALLRRVTNTFSSLTREGKYNAIGVGFEHLLREEEKRKRESIIELLFTRRERALRWLVDEIAGWQVV